MDRENKFRGKRKDNGEWVFGYYFEAEGYHYIKPFDSTVETTASADTVLCNLKAYEVDPKTVGRYTGLKDKNKVEIYKDDIFKITHSHITDMAHQENLRLVKWEEDRPVLTMAYMNGDTRVSGYTFCRSNSERYFEVVGNIHQDSHLLDNRELLEGK